MKNENLIRKIAVQSLEIEAAAINGLKSSINEGFINSIDAVFNSSGRLIVTGVGKSAIIAQKIVSTLNSTGTPSLFMHAADAVHGDLGMIQSDDMVLLISKSGNTAEIKVLVPFLQNRGSQLIGMVSNLQSYLAQQADFVLHTPISQEADPNNLAPTASTTAQMALGDAFASALLALRGFTSADFAQFHPGGSLGKQLYLRIRDIYTQNEKPAVSPDATIRQTILEITGKRLGATAVVGAEGELLGLITDGDLRRMLEREEDTRRLCAADIMTPQPKSITSDALAVKGLEILRTNSITQLLVVDEGQYLGMIHLHDLIREGLI